MITGGAGAASTPVFYARVFNQHEGAPDHRLSPTERASAGAGKWRGRSDVLSVLVEHQDFAAELVSAGQGTVLLSIRCGAPSRAQGCALRPRSLAERDRQGA